MKKILLFLIILLVSVPFALAGLDTNLDNFYTFNTDYANSIGSNDFTNSGATLTSGKLSNAITFVASENDYALWDSFPFAIGADYSVTLWFKSDDTINAFERIYGVQENSGANVISLEYDTDGNINAIHRTDNGVEITAAGTVDYMDGTWHHVVVTWDQSEKELSTFFDGSSSAEATASNAGADNLAITKAPAIGSFNDKGTVATSYDFTGQVDALGIYSREITTLEIAELYNSGTGVEYPFASPPAPTGNQSLETNILFTQTASVLMDSNTYQIIESRSFISPKSTNASISVSLELSTTKALEAQCKVLIDGVDYNTETNRSFDSRSIGNIYMLSSVFKVYANVTTTAQLLCRRASVDGKIKIDKSVGIISLFQYNDENFKYQYGVNNFSINSSEFQLVKTAYFLTSNKSSIGLTRALVFDGQISYNYDSTATIEMYSLVNGVKSPTYTRYGTAGSIGSGGNFNIVLNVTNQTSVPIQIYAKSSSGDGSVSVKSYVKEMISHTDEFVIESLNNTVLNSNVWATAKTISLNVSNQNISIVVKASASTRSTSGDQTIDYRLYYNGSAYSPEYKRNIIDAGTGVSILQYVFTNVDEGIYDVELQYKTSGGNAIIEGGSIKTFISGDINPIINSFLVTATNAWTSGAILDFNVTVDNGLTFSSNSTGTAIVTSSNLATLNISATNFFDSIFLNHNSSNDLIVNMTQSSVNVTIFETFSGNPISDWTLKNGTTILINTTTNSGLFYPAPGEYNSLVLSSNSGAFGNRNLAGFNVSLFDIVYYGYTILPTDFNVTATNIVTDAAINDFTLTYSSLNRSHSGSFTTTTGIVSFGVVTGDIYNLTIDAPGYATFGASVLQTISGNGNKVFELYVMNTLNITFRNETDNSIIKENISFELISDAFSYNYTVLDGNLYVDLISPQSYTARYTADGFDQRFYYFTLTNRSYNELTLYLTNGNYTEVTATVYDQNNNLLENAVIRYLKYDTGTNTYILQGMAETNFEGITKMPLVLNSEYYKFQIYYGGVLRSTTTPSYVYESDLTFKIFLTDLVGETYFDRSRFNGDVSYNNVSSNAKFEFSSGDGLDYEFCFNIYEVDLVNGNTLLNTSCLISSSGMILIPFNLVNGTSYLFDGLVNIDNYYNLLDQEYIGLKDTVPNKKLFLFMFLILSALFALIGLYSLRMAFILTPLPLFLGSVMMLIPISPAITGGFLLLGIIFAGVMD